MVLDLGIVVDTPLSMIGIETTVCSRIVTQRTKKYEREQLIDYTDSRFQNPGDAPLTAFFVHLPSRARARTNTRQRDLVMVIHVHE